MFQKLVYRLGVAILRLFSSWMLHRDIVRNAPLPPGPKIFAVNHPSTTDPFYLLTITPEQISILISRIAFNAPLFGRYLRAAGHVEVDKSNARLAFNQAVELLKQGRTIGIFPEGSLSPAEGGLCPARTGVARLALLTGAPIIPVGVALDRTRLRIVKTTLGDLTDDARWYLNGPYSITIGEPIYLDGDINDWEYVRSAAQSIMDEIGALAMESTRRQATFRSTTWFRFRTWLPLRVLNPIVG